MSVCKFGNQATARLSPLTKTARACQEELTSELDELIHNLQQPLAATDALLTNAQPLAPLAPQQTMRTPQPLGVVISRLTLQQIAQLSMCDDFNIVNSQPQLRPLQYRTLGCKRGMSCCCNCTIACDRRCLHDCFVRLWFWAQELKGLGVDFEPGARLLPLTNPHFATQCTLMTVCTGYRHLTRMVNGLITGRNNPAIRDLYQREGINPGKMDYSQQLQLTADGKIIADPVTGHLKIRAWPESGLCPYCLPRRSIDNRKRKKRVGERHK